MNLDQSLEPSPSESRRVRRLWTAAEDEQLRLLVSYWGDQCGKNGHWDKISAQFEHRSAKDCRKRWFHSLDPKLRRGRWTEAEDKILIDAYARLGPSWQRIAQLIPGRTDDQCSKRYNDVLDPKAQDRLRDWEPAEDAKLLALIDKYGTRWRDICRHMEGRTPLVCRNRWRKLQKQQERPESPEGRTGPAPPAMNLPSQPQLPVPAPVPPQLPNHTRMVDSSLGLNDSINVPLMDRPTTYTLTLDSSGGYDRAQPPETVHYPIAESELTKVLDFASKTGQKIVIHQHIYPTQPAITPAPETPRPQQIDSLGSPPPPPPEDVFLNGAFGSFSNMDYLAFNPS